MSSSVLDGGRDGIPDLLARPPIGTSEFVTEWANVLVDPVRQLEALARLLANGLISRDEFERYSHQVRSL